LESVRTIAMVGASSNWNRPSYFVMKYLQGKGLPGHPGQSGIAGQQLLGETVYASLRDIPKKSTWSTCPRRAGNPGDRRGRDYDRGAGDMMQLGVRNDERRRWPRRPASKSS